MESQVKILEDKDTENIQKYNELLQAKSQQDSNFMEAVTRKAELESIVATLKTELEIEKSSKVKINTLKTKDTQ